MKACAFFGCSKGNYKELTERLRDILVVLIENEGVIQFYSGGRGAFDEFASRLVGELRKEYPRIKNTLVISYMPPAEEKFSLPAQYTDSVYLLERRVPPRYAVVETNKKIAEKSDYVVVATKYSFGGAQKAREYAEKMKKTVIDLENLQQNH